MTDDKFLRFMAWYLLLAPIVIIGIPLYYQDWATLAVTSVVSLAGWSALYYWR